MRTYTNKVYCCGDWRYGGCPYCDPRCPTCGQSVRRWARPWVPPYQKTHPAPPYWSEAAQAAHRAREFLHH